jgi:hypothetical protein
MLTSSSRDVLEFPGLPTEIIFNVFCYLNFNDVMNISTLNCKFYSIYFDNTFLRFWSMRNLLEPKKLRISEIKKTKKLQKYIFVASSIQKEKKTNLMEIICKEDFYDLYLTLQEPISYNTLRILLERESQGKESKILKKYIKNKNKELVNFLSTAIILKDLPSFCRIANHVEPLYVSRCLKCSINDPRITKYILQTYPESIHELIPTLSSFFLEDGKYKQRFMLFLSLIPYECKKEILDKVMCKYLFKRITKENIKEFIELSFGIESIYVAILVKMHTYGFTPQNVKLAIEIFKNNIKNQFSLSANMKRNREEKVKSLLHKYFFPIDKNSIIQKFPFSQELGF